MKRISRIVLWLAIVGLIIPQVNTASAVTKRNEAGRQTVIVDVALTQGNLLRGQLVNGEGAARAGIQVTVSADLWVICQTTTDEQGVFAVRMERGGMYTLSDGTTSTLVRVWTNQAAPPSANDGVLMVSDENVSRANLSRRYGGLHGVLDTAAVLGAIGGVIWLAADNDDAS